MKQIIFLSLFTFVNAFAASHQPLETQLSCWSMYSKAGSAPFLTAKIAAKNALTVKLDLDSEYFKPQPLQG